MTLVDSPSRSIIPENEAARMMAVRRYNILDTPPDGAFDRTTAIASRLFNVPIAIISIVDNDQIWFKSHHGADVGQIDRQPGLCTSAILQSEPWILLDAKTDPRLLANPLVASGFGLRFYVGVPLQTSDGCNLGTLCIIDKEPRTVNQDQIGSGRYGDGPDGAQARRAPRRLQAGRGHRREGRCAQTLRDDGQGDRPSRHEQPPDFRVPAEAARPQRRRRASIRRAGLGREPRCGRRADPSAHLYEWQGQDDGNAPAT